MCIFAQQGTEFFKYCKNYKNPCLPVVEVTMYENRKVVYDKVTIEDMDKRWASQFRYQLSIIINSLIT